MLGFDYYIMYYFYLVKTFVLGVVDRFMGYSIIVQCCAIGVTLMIIVSIINIIRLTREYVRRNRDHKIIDRMHDRFYEPIKTILTTRETMGDANVALALNYDKSDDLGKHEKYWFSLLLRDVLFEVDDEYANMVNLHSIINVFHLDTYIADTIRTGTMEQKIRITRALRYFDIHINISDAIAKMSNSKRVSIRRNAIFTKAWNDPNEALMYFNSEEFVNNFSRFDMMIFHDIMRRSVSSTDDLTDIMIRLNSHDSPRLRSLYIREVRYLNLVECCPILIEIFESSSDSEINFQIARTWGKLKYKESEQILIKSFAFQANRVKVASIRAIATFATGNAEDFFISVYNDEYDYDVILEAIKALFTYRNQNLLSRPFMSIAKKEDQELFKYFEEEF